VLLGVETILALLRHLQSAVPRPLPKKISLAQRSFFLFGFFDYCTCQHSDGVCRTDMHDVITSSEVPKSFAENGTQLHVAQPQAATRTAVVTVTLLLSLIHHEVYFHLVALASCLDSGG
jgi:hypothetical protein